jgi:hypothetical protein
MNCCNSYGECQQGHGCPVRQACELQVDQDKPMRWIGRVLYVLMVLTVTGFLCWLLGVFGPSLDEHASESKSLRDAQAQAQRAFFHDVEAAKACRQLHGESLIRYTADGELVCVPRHSKQAIASNP